MSNGQVTLTGMVLSTMPVGDYDKRIVLLTRECGKVSGFARGARKPGNQMMAASNPFVFGEFEAYAGRDAYSFRKANIKNYFSQMTADFDRMCHASYFAEVADYYSVENADESERLILLYQTLRALESGRFSYRLIRSVYEIKTMALNGEYPDFFSCMGCGAKTDLKYFSMSKKGLVCTKCHERLGGEDIDESTVYAFQYIITTPAAKLYNFKLSEKVESELYNLLRRYLNAYSEHHFKSLDFLEE